MLYHWYELDLEATIPTGTGQDIRARSCAPIIRYDRTSAREQTQSGGCRITDHARSLSADNDALPDALPAQLRKAGLGAVGDPAYRFDANRRKMSKRFIDDASGICAKFSTWLTLLAGLPRRLMHRYASTHIIASHTMVLNGGNDQSVASRDAKRQLFELRAQ